MNREIQGIERTLNHFYQGYISVKHIRDLEIIQTQNRLRTSGSSFRVLDILRTSSKRSSLDKSQSEQVLPTSLFTLLQHGKRGNFHVTIKTYFPSVGIDTTDKEVARLRFLAANKGLAQFEGVHFSDVPPPVYVFVDHLFSVRQWLSEDPNQRSREVPNILEQTADAVAYLHVHKLVHMELSQNTVTVNVSGQVKLTGSCLSRVLNLPTHEEEMAGDFVYLPPDVLRGTLYSETSDIYSFSLFAYELLLGVTAFSEQRHQLLRDFIRTVEPLQMITKEDNLHSLETKIKDLVCRCLVPVTDKFPRMEEIKLKFKQQKDTTVQLRHSDTQSRNGCYPKDQTKKLLRKL